MYLPTTAWVGWLLLSTALASLEPLNSYEDVVKRLEDSAGKDTYLLLAAGHQYKLTDSLTIIGVPSITVEGPTGVSPADRPTLSCASLSPAVVANATLVRLANLQFEGCVVPAVVLYSPSSVIPVSWSILNVSFRGNGAGLGNLVVTQPTAEWTAFTASAVLVPELKGNLSIGGSSFVDNSGGFGNTYASPAVAVSCSSNCSVTVDGSLFAGNSGTHASGFLLQTSGAAHMRVTRTQFVNNTASWIGAPRFFQRFPLPPASLSYMALSSAPPAQAEFELQDVLLQRSISSHALAFLRLAPSSPASADIRLRMWNVTLSDHGSGPAPLLAVGVRQAVLTAVNISTNVVPPADKLSVNLIGFTRGLLCSGALACLALDASPNSSISISNWALYNNTNINTGALFVTTLPNVLSNNATAFGSLRVDGLRALSQSSSTLGVAVRVTSVLLVHFSSGVVSDNTVGGGLAIEYADNVTVTNVTFAGNVRELLSDSLGNPVTAFGRGAGLWMQLCRNVIVRDCTFWGNRAFTGGGAALFSNVSTLELSNVNASNNEVFGSATGGGDGGAFLISGAEKVALYDSWFRNNRAVRNGGALSLDTWGDLSIRSVLFDGNVANISGGAIWLTSSNRGSDVNMFANCTFLRNVALAGRSSWVSSTASLSIGGGGAVSSSDVNNNIRFYQCRAANNSAPFGSGGALNLQSSATASFINGILTDNTAGISGGGIYLSNMLSVGSSYVIQSSLTANAAGTLADGDGRMGLGGAIFVEGSVLQVQCSELHDNIAKKGGALYAHLQAQVAIFGTEGSPTCPTRIVVPGVPRATPASGTARSRPQGHTAIRMDTPYATVLTNNTALVGGAVYVENSVLRVHADAPFIPPNPGVLFANNTAVAGGAILAYSALEIAALADFYNNTAAAAALREVTQRLGLAEASTAVPETPGTGGALGVRGFDGSVFTARDSAFVGNSATDGGAVHITSSESCPSAAGCFTTRLVGCVLANNTARGGGGGGVFWEHLGLLNITCGASTAPPRLNGTAGSPLAPPPTSSDNAVHGDGSGGGSRPLYHRAPPAQPLDVSMLACDSWSGNAAVDGAYGSDVASTGFSLGAAPYYISFYTSSAPIAVNLSMMDYYGQLCTGGNLSAVIRAVSPQVFGQTYMASTEGTAAFTDLKLRARSGWQDINFAASTAFRDLQGSGMTVYVRPCVIGEYLSPTLDQCLQCGVGYYNFNHTASNCHTCSDDAFCSDPKYPGMIVPHLGYWHSNFFSEQIASCPNSAACTYPNRTVILAEIQRQVKQLSEHIQASLVQWPAAFHQSTVSANTTAARMLLLQAQVQRVRDRADGLLVKSGAGAAPQGAVVAGQPGAEAAPDVAPFWELRRRMVELLAGGENPYGPSNDDMNYTGLLQAVDDLAAKYSSAMCSNGYVGVLCGSCAPGYGSAGPATCRLCPPAVINNLYYALAMLLTLFILGWTIRSLLHQSLLAAHTARGERKFEVMDELRIMGRPLVNPSLIAVLDEDELPDDRSQRPIYGKALRPSLDGLVALRAAYRQQALELDYSIHSILEQQQQQQHRHQLQQQQRVGAGVGRLAIPIGTTVTAAATQRTRPWSMRRLQVAAVPVPGGVTGGGSPTDSGTVSPLPLSPQRARGRQAPLAISPSGDGGDGVTMSPGAVMSPSAVPMSPSAVPMSPCAVQISHDAGGPISPTAGLALVTSSPFVTRQVRIDASLGDVGCSGSGGGGATEESASERPVRGGSDSLLTPACTETAACLGGMYDSRYGSGVEDSTAAVMAAAAAGGDGDVTDCTSLESDGGCYSRHRTLRQQQVQQLIQRAQQNVSPQLAPPLLQQHHQQQLVLHPRLSPCELRGFSPLRRSADMPPQAVAEGGADSDAAGLAGGEGDDDGGGEADRDPRDSAQDRPEHSGCLVPPAGRARRFGGGGGGGGGGSGQMLLQAPPAPPLQLRNLKLPPPEEAVGEEATAAAAAAERPVDRDCTADGARSQLEQRPQRPQRQVLPKSALEAILGQRGHLMSGGRSKESFSGYLYGSSGDGGLLVPPRTASASASTVVRRPWFGLVAGAGGGRTAEGVLAAAGGSAVQTFGGVHGSFPRRQTMTDGSTTVSPRMASLHGMPAPFMAEVRRRQVKLDAPRGGARVSALPSGPSRLYCSAAEEGADAGAGYLNASGRMEIELLRSGSCSTIGSRMSLRSLGAVLRRRLGGGGAGGGMDTSRPGSTDISRLGLAGASTHSARGGGNELRWNEFGVDEFGPADEEFGSAVGVGLGGGGGGGGRGGPAALAPPDHFDRSRDCPNAIRADSDAHPLQPLQDAATIKIFISYVQILALVKAVPIPSPPRSVSGYLRFYDQITAIPGSLVSLDCSLPGHLAVSKAMQRTILASLAPLYVSVGVAVVWLGIMLVSYAWERRSQSFRWPPRLAVFARSYLPPRLVMSFTTVMFYFYPNTVRSLLSIFSCVSLDSPTENKLAAAAGLHLGKYWTLDYSEQCYLGHHLALALGLGLTGLLLLGVGWPVGVAVWLYNKGREQALDFSDFSMVVYASYRELYQLRFLYWESVIMLRQMAVAVVVVLLAQRGVTVQMLVVIAVVAAAFVAQLLVQPFRTRSMNRLEELSLVVIMITLYLNLYLLSPDVNMAGHTILAVFIIGINAVMLAVFVYYITRTSWDKQLDKMGLDRRRVYDMDPTEIRASLRRRYGPRTAEWLTRVVTSAQTLRSAKSTIYQTGSIVGRHMASSLRHGDDDCAAAKACDALAATGDPLSLTRTSSQEKHPAGTSGIVGSVVGAAGSGLQAATPSTAQDYDEQLGAGSGRDNGGSGDKGDGAPLVAMRLERSGSGGDC